MNESNSLGTAVFRGVLWGLLAAFLVVVVVVVALRGREQRAAPPPVLSQLPAFELTASDGRAVTLGDLAGRPWVADFIFTRCTGPCPRMTRRMAELGGLLPTGVGRVSFTVDPEHDTPAVLADYAAAHGAPPSWLFLTGDRRRIWDLSVAGFKLAVADAAAIPDAPAGDPGDPDATADPASPAGLPPAHRGPLLHSTRFVLVDGSGRIRGYYDAFDPAEVERLVREARAVGREG